MEQLRNLSLRYSYRNLIRCLNIPFHDTNNNAKSSKTVIAVPGSPGTHHDFKYFIEPLERKHIRLISMNWPGQGECPAPADYLAYNEERTALISDFIDKLQLDQKPILMTHSAGGYPVVRLAAENPEKMSGLLLICPGGQTPHRIMRPYWAIKFYAWLWSLKRLRPISRYAFYIASNMIGFKVSAGEFAGIAAYMGAHLDLPQYRECVAKVGSNKRLPVMMFWGRNDPLVEAEKSLELCQSLEIPSVLIHKSKLETLTALESEIQRKGHIRTSVSFKDSGHFAQKTEADFISDCLEKFL